MTEPTYRRRSLYLSAADTLVVADLHVGHAASSAVDRPLGERDDIATRLGAVCAATTPETVVIAGDLLHASDGVPDGVPRTVDAVLAATGTADVVVTPGNHDQFLDVVTPALPTPPTYRVDEETVICHGHVEPSPNAAHYIVGHDHPALEVAGDRHPCFLRGEDQYEGATVTMLPTFSRLPRGTPVADRTGPELGSPLISDLDACRPVVVADTVHEFPPLAELRPHL